MAEAVRASFLAYPETRMGERYAGAETGGELRPWLMGAIGCVLAGAVTLGAGSRIAMRIAGMLTPPEFIGTPTVGGNIVGRVTIGGSIGLVWIGALGGIVGGMVYLVVRRWLPMQPVLRGLWFGLLAILVFGRLLIDDGTDFRFADAGLQVGMYAIVFLSFGLLGSWWAERLGRGLPDQRPTTAGYAVVGAVTVVGLATLVEPVMRLFP